VTGDCRKLNNEKNELISATFTKTFFTIVTRESTQTTHHVMEANCFLFQTVSLEERSSFLLEGSVRF